MKWLDPNFWKGLHRVIGLECPPEAEGEFRYLILAKDQNKIKTKDSGVLPGIDAVRELLEKEKKTPVMLGLWGDHVFERLVPDDRLDEPVQAVLGVSVEDTDDFGVEVFAGWQEKSLVSLIRKTKVEDCLAWFGSEISERIVNASISNAVMINVLAQLRNLMEENYVMEIGESRYFIKEGRFGEAEDLLSENYETIAPADMAAGLGIAEENLRIYAMLLRTWMQGAQGRDRAPLAHTLRAFCVIARLRHSAVAMAMVAGIWFALLFFLRMQGENKKAELEATYAQNLPVLNALTSLDERIEARQSLRERLGNQTLKASKASFYYDRIAAVSPEEVRMTQLVYMPDEEQFKRAGLREPTAHQLILQGNCDRTAPIARFSKKLSEQDWAGELEVHRSEMNFQEQVYEFTFLISLIDV